MLHYRLFGRIIPLIKRKTPAKFKYKIVKVVKLGNDRKRITIRNAMKSELVFYFDGSMWRWDTSKHIVDVDICKALTKEYKKYLKKENKQ